MQLNYTRRLALSVASYTFFLTLLCLTAVWIYVERAETDETARLAHYISLAIEASQQAAETGKAVIQAEEFDFYADASAAPPAIRQITTPGYHELADGRGVLTGMSPDLEQRYYLVFKPLTVGERIESEFDDILFIITGVLLSTGLALGVVWLMARRLAAPVLELKALVQQVDIESDELPRMERDDEIGQLSDSFCALLTRMRQFALRERDFTRFASHELRTPVTVIQGNLDLLQESLPDSALNRRILTRMQSAAEQMTRLIEGFLWLGRESRDHSTLRIEPVDGARLQALLEKILQPLSDVERDRVQLSVAEIHWQVRPLMLAIALENLIRNALIHGEGDIHVWADQEGLQVENHVTQLASADVLYSVAHASRVPLQSASGHGLGLQIVARICEQNGWACDWGCQSDRSAKNEISGYSDISGRSQVTDVNQNREKVDKERFRVTLKLQHTEDTVPTGSSTQG